MVHDDKKQINGKDRCTERIRSMLVAASFVITIIMTSWWRKRTGGSYEHCSSYVRLPGLLVYIANHKGGLAFTLNAVAEPTFWEEGAFLPRFIFLLNNVVNCCRFSVALSRAYSHFFLHLVHFFLTVSLSLSICPSVCFSQAFSLTIPSSVTDTIHRRWQHDHQVAVIKISTR